MAPVGSFPTDDTAVNVAALRSSSAGVRLAAVKALLEDASKLPPFADQILPLVADSDPEVRQLADELVTQMGFRRETLTAEREERNQSLKCGATWKCLCVPGFGVEALPSDPLSPPWAINAVADDFDTCSAPASPSYSPAWRVAKSARRCSGPRDPRDPRMVVPLEHLCCEPKQHWRVRDALAFTPKALQGDVLVRLLKDTEPGLRESVLLALRRLVPIYWVRHADAVSATLADAKPQVRVAALVALFHLDASDLDFQVPRIVAALRDELWPVREAALQTLRKLRPEQLQRLSREVLRCKLDPSLRVRSAAQRVLERLAPNVLADLACKGARGGASPNYVYSSTY